MIDWKDVNKELPEGGRPVKIKTEEIISSKKHTRTGIFYDEFSIFGVKTFFAQRTGGFRESTEFKGYVKNKVEQIKFWAYINKPSEEV